MNHTGNRTWRGISGRQRQGDALLHTSFMADVLGAVLEVAANVVIDALIVGITPSYW